VHHADGTLARSAGALTAGETVRVVFSDGSRNAVIDGPAPPIGAGQTSPAQAAPGEPRPAPRKKATGAASQAHQGDLF
jgi:exodeoxyribonuclease VII large subunit